MIKFGKLFEQASGRGGLEELRVPLFGAPVRGELSARRRRQQRHGEQPAVEPAVPVAAHVPDLRHF